MTKTAAFFLLSLFAFTACSGESRRDNNPNPPPKKPPNGTEVCGNGAINGTEPCDGSAFSLSRDCALLNLGTGQLGCNATCQLDLSTCSFRDYCTANNLYANMQCDNCELLGGPADPECNTACAADGVCGDRFDELTGQWTCRRRGLIDPDCGTCGNQIIEGAELCDGPTFKPGSNRCEDWGYEEGTLGCSNCLPTFAECRAASCGDGAVEGPERCEAGMLGSATCEAAGFAGGMLTCTSTCGFSYAGCVAPGCGNNIVETTLQEECESQNLGGATCETLGYAGGTISCNAGCRLETSACIFPGCNNGLIEAPQEECETGNLNGGTCQNQGFAGGTLACSSSSCTFDTSGCVAAGCGNNIIEEPTEQCESGNLNNLTCQSLGFLQGNLGCDGNCRYDTSGCVAAGCGNSIIEAPAEECEGSNLNGQTCQTQGFLDGTLSCTSCQYDTTTCEGRPCGDGVSRGLESCDGGDFTSSNDCNMYGLGFANMTCTADCRLDFNDCGSSTDFCLTNSFYGDGVCDDCVAYGGTLDSDCTGGCGSNGTCVSYYDGPIGSYTCLRAMGANDPDCGCGNGQVSPTIAGGLIPELCDGSGFFTGAAACTDWRFSGGTLSCGPDCLPNFSNCTP